MLRGGASTALHARSSSYFDRSAVLHNKKHETESEMTETSGQHAAGDYNYAGGSPLHEFEELEYVYEDIRIMLEQASQEMYVMRQSGD